MEKLLNQAEINEMFRAALGLGLAVARLPSGHAISGRIAGEVRALGVVHECLPATERASGAYPRVIFEVTWPPWARFLSCRTHLDLVFLAAY